MNITAIIPSEFYYIGTPVPFEYTGDPIQQYPNYPNLSPHLLQGWVCPVCGVVNGPLTSMCANSTFYPSGTSGLGGFQAGYRRRLICES